MIVYSLRLFFFQVPIIANIAESLPSLNRVTEALVGSLDLQGCREKEESGVQKAYKEHPEQLV